MSIGLATGTKLLRQLRNAYRSRVSDGFNPFALRQPYVAKRRDVSAARSVWVQAVRELLDLLGCEDFFEVFN
jgi:hypothetical protein